MDDQLQENQTANSDNSQPSIVDELNNKINEVENKYKRLLAEKLNNERQFETQKAFVTVKLLEQIIDIKDDLEIVINQIPESEKESLGVMGSNMVFGKLSILLMTSGINEIETKEGDDFDASKHEAVTVQEVENMSNKVVKVLRKGYVLQDRVLRPVRVIVGK